MLELTTVMVPTLVKTSDMREHEIWMSFGPGSDAHVIASDLACHTRVHILPSGVAPVAGNRRQ